MLPGPCQASHVGALLFSTVVICKRSLCGVICSTGGQLLFQQWATDNLWLQNYNKPEQQQPPAADVVAHDRPAADTQQRHTVCKHHPQHQQQHIHSHAVMQHALSCNHCLDVHIQQAALLNVVSLIISVHKQAACAVPATTQQQKHLRHAQPDSLTLLHAVKGAVTACTPGNPASL